MRDRVSHPSNLTASSAVLRGSEEGGDRGRERGREGVIGRAVVVVVVAVVVETVREDEWRNSSTSHSLLISCIISRK